MTSTRDTVRANGTPDPFRAALDLLAQAVPEWTVDALCAQTDPEIFFPGKGGTTRAAKEVCAECPVRAKCLAYALEHEDGNSVWPGVYGGLSVNERKLLRVNKGRGGRPTHKGAR